MDISTPITVIKVLMNFAIIYSCFYFVLINYRYELVLPESHPSLVLFQYLHS